MLDNLVLWVDKNGFPYTSFKDNTTLLKYRTLQEKYSSKLEDWYYLTNSEWLERFSTSQAHMDVYDYVMRDHMNNLESIRLNVFLDDGSIIKTFTSFDEARKWFTYELETYFYWHRFESYYQWKVREAKANGKSFSGPHADKHIKEIIWKAKFHSTKVGNIFLTTHNYLMPTLPLSAFIHVDAKRHFLYLPLEMYITRHEMLLRSKVYTN